ncbi:MAG: hypothetical protein U9N31_07020 [Candidatus Marinimicrobia bacterium]|nr:hypothetical protein [Candidatus Neomarinimicrobiota bacterium]
MIIKLNKSFAVIISIYLLCIYISGCTSTKPNSDQDNFAPDSISNLLTELSDGNIVEYYENGLYEHRNSNGELLDQGNYLYNKIDGTHGEVVFNNGDNPYMRVSFTFNNPIFGYYKWNAPPYESGRFQIINRKKKTLESFDQALDYVYGIGKGNNKDLSPTILPQGVYRFFIQTQEKPVKKGILFFITINENGQYSFEQKHENPMAPHKSHFRYTKKDLNKAELILSGFDQEIFYLTFQNTDSGIFTKRSAQRDYNYDGIFLKE